MIQTHFTNCNACKTIYAGLPKEAKQTAQSLALYLLLEKKKGKEKANAQIVAQIKDAKKEACRTGETLKDAEVEKCHKIAQCALRKSRL